MTTSWTAVILAGGRGKRLGNVEKSQLQLGDQTLLDAVIDGLPRETPVVVVGPEMPTRRPVHFCLEEPRFGGPVAGLAAALPHIDTPFVALLATDMPNAGSLAQHLVDEFDGAADGDALVPVDVDGRRQPLCSVIRTPALRRAVDALATTADVSIRTLMSQLAVIERQLTTAEAAAIVDVDTPEDLDRLRRASGQR